MATAQAFIQVKVTWWFHLYLYGVVTAAVLTGAEPDWGKVSAMIARATRWRFLSERRWRRCA